MAMTRRGLMFGGVGGFLMYDDKSPVGFSVSHPDPKVVERVTVFLRAPRKFRVPESQQLDDYRVDLVEPVSDPAYFEQALCVMNAETEVEVLWGG